MARIEMLREISRDNLVAECTRENFPCERCSSDAEFVSNEGVGKYVRAVIACHCGHTFRRTFMPARWIT